MYQYVNILISNGIHFIRCSCKRQIRIGISLSFTATADKMNAIADEDVDILVHLCPNCHIQFDRYQHLISEREGRNFRAIHLNITQFMALAMGGDFDKVIGAKAHTVPIDSVIKDLKEVEK